MPNQTHDLPTLKAERKQLRFLKDRLENNLKTLRRRRRDENESAEYERIDRDIVLVTEELNHTKEQLSDIAHEIAQLEVLSEEERDTFSVTALSFFARLGVDREPDYLHLLLGGAYRDARSDHPEWHLPRMQDLRDENQIIAALGWIADDVVRLPDETFPQFQERLADAKSYLPAASQKAIKDHLKANAAIPLYPPVQNEATKPEPMAGCGGVKSGQ